MQACFGIHVIPFCLELMITTAMNKRAEPSRTTQNLSIAIKSCHPNCQWAKCFPTFPLEKNKKKRKKMNEEITCNFQKWANPLLSLWLSIAFCENFINKVFAFAVCASLDVCLISSIDAAIHFPHIFLSSSAV